jgi:hypothetical protein
MLAISSFFPILGYVVPDLITAILADECIDLPSEHPLDFLLFSYKVTSKRTDWSSLLFSVYETLLCFLAMASSLKPYIGLWYLATSVQWVTAAVTVNSTLLVLARDYNATVGGTVVLQGYGIPYQVVDLSSAAGLPQLNSTPDKGNFGGIVTVSAREYKNGDDWKTALSDKQWQDMYRYQEAFGIRLVRLNAWPSTDYGVQSSGGLVSADQPVALTDTKSFPTANLKAYVLHICY